MLPKNFWTRVLGSVVIQLYADDSTPSADRALLISISQNCSLTQAMKFLVCDPLELVALLC